MKLNDQSQINYKIQNQYDQFKQIFTNMSDHKQYGLDHTNIKSLKNFYQKDQIIIQQDTKRILSKEDYKNMLLIYQNNCLEKKQNLNRNDDQQSVRISQTDSLSFIQDQQEDINILDSDNLLKLLKEKGNLFTYITSIDFIITTYKIFSDSFENFEILINKGNYSNIYQGYCFKREENIAIKIENYSWTQFIENQFQYQLQFDIYNLYPNLFLRIDLPVFISIQQSEQVQVISKHELGEMNLYYYSQYNKIMDRELALIQKQLLNQILLLHRYNIAHRDIKPQNIIFVKEKGWLLCDFEFSIKYINKICVTSIRGTKCFLPFNLQYHSCQAGVCIKQDLFYNDLYALGITMLIIKYQISSSNDIDQYLEIENDPEILSLLNQQQNFKLQEINIDSNVEYIEPVKPIQMQQKLEQSEILNTEQVFSMLITLKYFGNINMKLRDQLIKLIDKNLNIERDDYLYLNFWIHEQMETYLPIFKNIFRLEVLKSAKFWRQLFKICKITLCSILFRFMHNLGLSDLLLQLGKNFLNQNYQITIHSYIIKQLLVLKEHNQMIQEYQDMIKIKDFQYLTSEDQREIAQLQMQLFSLEQIEEKELYYLSQYYIDEQKTSQINTYHQTIINQINNYDNSKEKLSALIDNFVQFSQDVEINQFNFKVIYALDLYQVSFNQIDIKDLIQFDMQMINKLKYYCQAPIYVQLLKQSMFFQFLYGYPKNIQRYKNINMMLLYQSESYQQQIVLNLIKQSSFLIYSIKKQRKINQIIQKVIGLCKNYEQIQYSFYKSIFLNQIFQILEDQRQQEEYLFQKWYRVLLWLQKLFKDISIQFDERELGAQYQRVTCNWMKIRGKRRHDKLVNDITIKNRRIKQLYEINYIEKMSIQFLFQIRQYTSISQIFSKNQYLLR